MALARFKDFAKDLFGPDGTVNKQRFDQFCTLLDQVESQQAQTVTRIVERTITSTTGGGGGAAPALEGPTVWSAIPNTCNAAVGNFIYRSGTTLGLADNRAVATAATDYVFRVDGDLAYITPIYKSKGAADGIVLLKNGAGNNSNTDLYLYRDGTCTDNIADIRSSQGVWQNGARFVQVVAVKVAANRTGYVVSDINIHRPGAG
jgi:hypothetical protein